MNIFLDTSSLFQLYHQETNTEFIENILAVNNVTGIFLSEISKLEFTSTVWKKVRIKEISYEQAIVKLFSFENDFSKYTFISLDEAIITEANSLINKYGQQGLRTLDSIQLATAVSLLKLCDMFIATDKLLDNLFVQELLPVPVKQ